MKKLALALIKIYQALSPFRFMTLNRCRFYPTCSQYTCDAVNKYGVTRGFYLGLKRFFKCNPFHEGGYDPVK